MRSRGWLLAPLLLTLTSLTTTLLTLTSTSSAQTSSSKWFAVQTEHVVSYSDESDRGAREAAQRTEQLIAVFQEIFHRKSTSFATPLRVMVVHAAPQTNGSTATLSTLARTPIANYVTVDLSQPESWTEAARSIATLTLEDNYPRAQPWFDSGIASYLTGVRFSADQMELGGAPPGLVMPAASEWIPIGKLLEVKDSARLSSVQDRSTAQSQAQNRAFEAESWALVRWLIENSRMAQAGAYLNAVQWRGATTERAVAEAFSISPADLDREVRESLTKLATRKMAAPHVDGNTFHSSKVSAVDMHVHQANLSLFGPDGDSALQELTAFMRENQENAMVHRSLAWAFLLRNDLENAVEHIRRALALQDSDATMHYLYARWVNRGDDNVIHLESAEVKMGTELKAALRRDQNYAAALELLGLAQLSDHEVKPALENLQRASALRPRSSRYSLNLARAYEAGGNLETARNLMLFARDGSDKAVTAEARILLEQIGSQKRQARDWRNAGLQPQATAAPSKYDNLQDAIAEDEAAEAKSKRPETAPDTRKVEYLKGRVISVECSPAAAATLAVEAAGHRWRIRVADRTKVVMLGVEHFDCGWSGLSVSINYKRAGSYQGDLVSLEAD
jgi:tetratricopeptide (TPR) repeat protein